MKRSHVFWPLVFDIHFRYFLEFTKPCKKYLNDRKIETFFEKKNQQCCRKQLEIAAIDFPAITFRFENTKHTKMIEQSPFNFETSLVVHSNEILFKIVPKWYVFYLNMILLLWAKCFKILEFIYWMKVNCRIEVHDN